MDTKTLIDNLATRTELSKKDVGTLLEAFTKLIGSDCAQMDSIALPSFGTFEPRKRLERVMVMPGSGKRMLLPPKIALSFKPSAMLKQRIKSPKS